MAMRSGLLCLWLQLVGGRMLNQKYVSVKIGETDCDVLKFGAKGDGKTDDTKAIQAAMDHCGSSGGGRVVLTSPHTYLIFSIAFNYSNLELNIPAGTELKASNDVKAWAKLQGASAVIVAKGHTDKPLRHIAITGRGVVEGQGLVWWKARSADRNAFRPHMVDFNKVNTAHISDVLFRNGPNHILELYCDNCELSGVKVLNPPSTGECEHDASCSHNTDAVDVHGDPFWIHDVNFTTGDDNIAGHANNTLVEDSYFGTGHGASIGSLCNDFITNFTVRNCSFHGTTTGIRIKSHAGCNGHVWNARYTDLVMYDVPTPIELSQFYSSSLESSDASSGSEPGTMRFERIDFRNITSYHAGGGEKVVMDFNCDTHFDSNHNCDVTLDTIKHINPTSGNKGMVCKGVRGTATNVEGIASCLEKGLDIIV